MFYISEIKETVPAVFDTPLQEMVYETLLKLQIPFKRVDTGEAISMDDCIQINRKLTMKMVKTLFLCNRQQTNFYLFVTTAEKSFKSKEFSNVLGVSRLSFASAELLYQIMGTKIGAATVFGMLLDKENKVEVVIDKDVVKENWYGCSDGTTTGYLKIKTTDIVDVFLNYLSRTPKIIEYNVLY